MAAQRHGQHDGPGGQAAATAEADGGESDGYEPSVASEADMELGGSVAVVSGEAGEQESEGEHNLCFRTSAERSDRNEDRDEER